MIDQKNKVLCIIPARSGSKTIKNKNIYKINGSELISYSIQFSKKLKFLNKIIFSSDSEKYLRISKKYGITNLHKRSSNLSKDNSLTFDLVKEILKEESKLQNFYQFILLLQPTSPFRQKKIFEKAFKILKKKNYDTVISIKKIKEHPMRMKILETKNNQVKNYLKLTSESLKPRQKLKDIYIRSGSMYFFQSKNIKKYKNIVGKKVYGIKTANKYSVNIDDYEDLVLANFYAKSK